MTCIEPLSPSLFMGEGFGVGVNQVFQQSPVSHPILMLFLFVGRAKARPYKSIFILKLHFFVGITSEPLW